MSMAKNSGKISFFGNEDTPLPTVDYLETTGEIVSELRKSIAGTVLKLSDATGKTDKLIKLLLRLKNEWSHQIVAGVSIEVILEYLDDIEAYMPLLSYSEREKIVKNMDMRDLENFGYEKVVQMGILPESLITSILQYPNKLSNSASSESISEMDNSTFAAYVLSCDIAERFFQKLKIRKNNQDVQASKNDLIEAFNILNIYWNSPAVQNAIRNVKPNTTEKLLVAKYGSLKRVLSSFVTMGKKSESLESSDTEEEVMPIEVDEEHSIKQRDALIASVRSGMELYIELIEDIKENIPHPSVLVGGASSWMIDSGA